MHKQALVAHRAVRNRRFEGATLANLAIIYRETGQLESAEHAHEAAEAVFLELNERRLAAMNQCDLAICLLLQRRWIDARAKWWQGTASLHSLGDTGELARKQATMREACAKAGVEPLDMLGEEPTNEPK